MTRSLYELQLAIPDHGDAREREALRLVQPTREHERNAAQTLDDAVGARRR